MLNRGDGALLPVAMAAVAVVAFGAGAAYSSPRRPNLSVDMYAAKPAPEDFEKGDPQDTPFMGGRVHKVHSEVLGEDRWLGVISLSGRQGVEGNREECKGCAVLYVQDPSDWMFLAAAITDSVSKFANLPQMLVVGAYNHDRTRDMLHAPKKWTPEQLQQQGLGSAGGAENFLAFFRDEAIPFITERYKTGNYRVLFGHSFGANFDLYAFINDPTVFQGYIATSPSIWYDEHSILDDLKKSLPALLKRRAASGVEGQTRFYHTIAGEGSSMLAPNLEVAAVFENHLHGACAGSATRDLIDPASSTDPAHLHLRDERHCSHGNHLGEWFASDKNGVVAYKFHPNYLETHHSQASDHPGSWVASPEPTRRARAPTPQPCAALTPTGGGDARGRAALDLSRLEPDAVGAARQPHGQVSVWAAVGINRRGRVGLGGH